MKGFFSLKETQSDTRPKGKTYSCVSCGLVKHANSPKMKPWGKGQKGIMNIGPFPSKLDDEKGVPFQGKAGRLLQKTYRKLGIDLQEDCVNINATRCITKDGAAPTQYSIDCCRPSILKSIKEYQPSVIILFGMPAIISVIGYRWRKDLGAIAKWRGWTIPDQDLKAWICPMSEPEWVLEKDKEVHTIWKQDIERALSKVNEKPPKSKPYQIDIIEDLSVLNTIQSGQISFDYESTGIKPQAKGHRIVCAAVADTPDHCYAFMMPGNKKERKPFLQLLENPNIGKMAHNMKFEDTWSLLRLRQPIDNWQWDSMLAAHLLDNRPNITSLKFQTYIHFGIIDYDSEINPYLQSGGKDGNAINRIMELTKTKHGREQLLTYCGQDTIYQYRLAMKQIEELDYDFLPF